MTQVNAPSIHDAVNAFALKMFKAVDKGDENVFFSPLSIHAALCMCAVGADGETLKQMEEVLSLEDIESAANGYRALLDGYSTPKELGKYDSGTPYSISVANALWAGNRWPLLEDYVAKVAAEFDAAVRTLDFSNGAAAADAINQWVDEKTKGKIKDLVTPPMFSEETTLVLTNAIHFKGSWDVAFSERATKDAVFKAVGGDSKRPFLNGTFENCGYAETDEYQLLNLHVKGGAGMAFFLPREGKEFDFDGVKDAFLSMKSETVQVSMPKFKIETQSNLGDVLDSLGMARAFSDRAEFGKIVDGQDSKISQVVHKAFVETDEKGVEAAAATAVMMMRCASVRVPKQPKIFVADRPFYFFITGGDAILFCGAMRK